MTDQKTVDLARVDKAEIIDGLYEVAVDPARYENLLEIWESRMAPLRAGSGPKFSDSEIEQHAARAWLFLDRYDEAAGRSSMQAALAELGRTAAFVCVDGRSVVAVNAAAEQLFGLGKGSAISTLPIEPEDVDALGRAVRDTVSGRQSRSVVVRARSPKTGGPIVFRIRPLQDGDIRSALVVTSELAWPEALTDTMREAFDLTLAEVEVVRAVTEGQSPKDIAKARNRSVETVRTQLRSILAKTETHSQSELVRVTLGLMDVVGDTMGRTASFARADTHLRDIPFSTVTLQDGRRYDFLEFGDASGRPCLFFPLDYGLTRWPASAEAAAERRNIRVVVPIRAGYGHSAPLPGDASYTDATAADALALLKQLGIKRTAVIALGADLRFAMHLATLDPKRVSGILGCAAMLPVQTSEQYERMDKWQRFILANGRHAPRILPFLVKAGFSMARRLGKERFFTAVNGGSPADIRTFANPEIRQAMILGSEVCLSDWHSSHDAFAREVLDSEINWADLVRACPVPVRLLQGDQDPQSPIETMRELEVAFPNLDIEYIEGAGQLLFFQEWPRVLNELEKLLPAA